MEVKIRVAEKSDANALLEIYSHYVKNTAVSFEYEVPSVEEFAGRISSTLKKYPYLVAEVDGKIAGYIYAGRFAKRAAYDWAAETSIYIGDNFHRLGLGRLLYEKLEHILAAQNITNVYAGIATPADEEDQYITKNSELFHAAIGYKTVGRFSKCGCKFGKWYDLIYMGKIISAHNLNPEPFVPFSKLNLQGLP